jgi:hypothetical protein
LRRRQDKDSAAMDKYNAAVNTYMKAYNDAIAAGVPKEVADANFGRAIKEEEKLFHDKLEQNKKQYDEEMRNLYPNGGTASPTGNNVGTSNRTSPPPSSGNSKNKNKNNGNAVPNGWIQH